MGARGGRQRDTLANAAEFSKVFRKGRTVRTRRLVIHTLSRGDREKGRYGLVVSKKVGRAVERNRVRRRLRAAIELAGGIPAGVDAVLVARPNGRPAVAEMTAEIAAVMEELPGRASREEA